MPVESAIVLAVVLLAVAALPAWNYWRTRDGNWHAYGRNWMRRMTPLGWVYRQMSEVEMADEHSSKIW